ncbi:hypothetical protein ACHMW6_35770 [Pseudoduganella sp. UC29_106]|uniref:hypothetical protein n=1 Tax=Pseudoduganella sp. UC29_106 TaxID=3374553 RepID=UPI0037578324
MTTRINITLFQPDHPRFTVMQAYQEVIDSLVWGFQSLGYPVTTLRNAVDGRAVNIVFGWMPAFAMGGMPEFPPNTILYNLEQVSVGSMKGSKVLEAAAAGFQIWDYSAANVRNWRQLNPRLPVYYAPVSYAPTLDRVPQREEEIDLLYIGSLGPKRSEKLIQMQHERNNVSMVTLANVWGRQRDEFIGRAKILLNVSNENPRFKVFEVARVSYYLANNKAVLCELLPDQDIEPDLQRVLRFAPAAELGDAADMLLADPQLRHRYAQECGEVFRQRDVRQVIRQFFG